MLKSKIAIAILAHYEENSIEIANKYLGNWKPVEVMDSIKYCEVVNWNWLIYQIHGMFLFMIFLAAVKVEMLYRY